MSKSMIAPVKSRYIPLVIKRVCMYHNIMKNRRCELLSPIHSDSVTEWEYYTQTTNTLGLSSLPNTISCVISERKTGAQCFGSCSV